MSEAIAAVEPPEMAARGGLARRVMRNPLGLASAVVLLLVLIAGLVGPFIAPFDPNHSDLAAALQAPGDGHLLGTDSAGRDVLSRLLVGARSTLLAAALAALVATVIGLPSGLVAGYAGGWFDSLATWSANVLMSLPSIVILLAVSAALGKSVWVSMTVFGVLMSPGFFRLTRTSVRSVRNELYVDAARVSGLGDVRIIGRHILFVVRPPIIIQASIVCGIAIAIQASLEFLGVGNPIGSSWGVMLNEGFLNIYTAPILLVWPGLAISITVCAFAIFGNALRDALEDVPTVARSHAARRSARQGAASHLLEQSAGASPQVPDDEHLLTVTGLSVGYPAADGQVHNVVSNVSLVVDAGEVVGIVGESGSGKSQTVFSILGLLPDNAQVTGGAITFDRTPLLSEVVGGATKQLASLRGNRIGYIPQEPLSNLDPNFTIGYQLMRPMVKVLGMSRAEAHSRALSLLETVGIADPPRTMSSFPHEVSGGMAQRVLIAGAVSCEPDLLIADEPTTALDVTVQAEVLDLLRDLQSRMHMAILLVTHNFGVVADLCHRVVVMRTGRIVETGDVRSLLVAPQHPYTKSLLAATLHDKEPLTMLTAGTESAPAPSRLATVAPNAGSVR